MGPGLSETRRWARTQWKEVGRGASGRLLGSSWEVGLQVTGACMLSHMSGVKSPLQEGPTDFSGSPITHPAVSLVWRCPTPWPQGKVTRRIHFCGKAATWPELSSVGSLNSLLLILSSQSSLRCGGSPATLSPAGHLLAQDSLESRFTL